MSHTRYETDVVAWANEQAALLRSGKLSEIDIEKIAEEIEDVGKSEQRELASRMTVLIAHLLKWKYQPARRGTSWERTIKAQRKEVLYSLKESPSLKVNWAMLIGWMSSGRRPLRSLRPKLGWMSIRKTASGKLSRFCLRRFTRINTNKKR